MCVCAWVGGCVWVGVGCVCVYVCVGVGVCAWMCVCMDVLCNLQEFIVMKSQQTHLLWEFTVVNCG